MKHIHVFFYITSWVYLINNLCNGKPDSVLIGHVRSKVIAVTIGRWEFYSTVLLLVEVTLVQCHILAQIMSACDDSLFFLARLLKFSIFNWLSLKYRQWLLTNWLEVIKRILTILFFRQLICLLVNQSYKLMLTFSLLYIFFVSLLINFCYVYSVCHKQSGMNYQ